MAARSYRFTSSFNLAAPVWRVHAVLVDLEHYSSWWPQVRAVAKLDDDRALVVCRSTLPYDLELELTAHSRAGDLLEVGINGPIRGWARFRLAEAGPGVTSVQFEQEAYAVSRPLAVASYVVKPVLAWNHHQMMASAERGLAARLQESAATAAS